MATSNEETEGEKVVLLEQLSDFRKRVAAGEELSSEELRDSVSRLQKLRDKTSASVKKSSTKKAASKITRTDAEDLLGDLL